MPQLFWPRKLKMWNSRRFKRVRSACLVKYEIPGHEPRVTNIKDLGAGGLSFWTDEAIPKSSVLNLGIFISPDEPPIQTTASVVRVSQARERSVYRVAVCFLELGRSEREALNRFAEAISEDPELEALVDHHEVVLRNS